MRQANQDASPSHGAPEDGAGGVHAPAGDFCRDIDKPHATVTMDSTGRVWATFAGQRRCLFQSKAGTALYRFSNGQTAKVDAIIGTVEVAGDKIILTLSL